MLVCKVRCSDHCVCTRLSCPIALLQGSDGLFDNMWDDQILEAVEEEQVCGACPTTFGARLLLHQFACASRKAAGPPLLATRQA